MSCHSSELGAVAYLIHSVEIIPYRTGCHITQVLPKNIEEGLQKSEDEDRVHCSVLSPKRLALKDDDSLSPLTGHAIRMFPWAT